MSKGCLYTDLDHLRTEYRIKGCEYARKLTKPLNAKSRTLYERKLADYQQAYEQINKLLNILPKLDLYWN